MSSLCLVTGANGHLGNNLVRALLNKRQRVRAGVRDLQNTQPFEDLDCERVYAELRDKDAMLKALEGVDVLYQVAAVFKHWSKDPETEIVQPNINGTKIVLEAAAEAGVKKVVYVSSIAAVGHNGEPLDETTWNEDMINPYYRSKILSERQAWKTANEHKLPMVVILPSTMIGPNAYALSDPMAYVEMIRKRELPLDPNFYFNFVDVRDVADGAISAAENGVDGERYIIANTHSSELGDLISAANKVAPGYKTLRKSPKWLLVAIAKMEELKAKLTGRRASLIVSQVEMFYGCKQEYNIDTAVSQLHYRPRTPSQALEETVSYLFSRYNGCRVN